jgi:hypothetical protein
MSYLLWLGPLAYIALQTFVLRTWSGGWRTAALAPLLLTVPLAAVSVWQLAQGSNLWPLPLFFSAPAALLYLLLLAAARRLSARPAAGNTAA